MNFTIKLAAAMLLAAVAGFCARADVETPRTASPETWSLKTNLLQDIFSTVSLGAEARLSGRVSLDLSGAWNPWTFSRGVKYKHWLAQPEVRLWTRRFGQGHFVGVHMLGGEFNLQKAQLWYNAYPDLASYRYEGWGIGAGLSYGYRWNFSRRWAMEGTVGVGYIHAHYNRYACGNCGERLGSGTKAYVGPTKIALNLIYRFGTGPEKKHVEPVERIVRDTLWRTDTVYMERRTVQVEPAAPDTVVLRPEIIHADFAMRLRYHLDKTDIDATLADNRVQIDSLYAFISRYADNPMLRIRSVDIAGYASVEGSAAHNLELSEGRAEAAAALVADMCPELAGRIHASGYGEDWSSLDFSQKEALMAIGDADERERALRRIDGGRLYRRLLERQLPQTRRIECTVNFSYIAAPEH